MTEDENVSELERVIDQLSDAIAACDNFHELAQLARTKALALKQLFDMQAVISKRNPAATVYDEMAQIVVKRGGKP